MKFLRGWARGGPRQRRKGAALTGQTIASRRPDERDRVRKISLRSAKKCPAGRVCLRNFQKRGGAKTLRPIELRPGVHEVIKSAVVPPRKHAHSARRGDA